MVTKPKAIIVMTIVQSNFLRFQCISDNETKGICGHYSGFQCQSVHKILMFSVSSSILLGRIVYNVDLTLTDFRCPRRKKSRGVRSGDLGGRDTGLRLPIHRLAKFTSRKFRTTLAKCGGAPSCCIQSLSSADKSFTLVLGASNKIQAFLY